MTYEWRVNQTASPSSDELQEALNALESKGYEVYSIFVVGHSVMVVARKPVLEMSEADRARS
jgi:hypothetical protein